MIFWKIMEIIEFFGSLKNRKNRQSHVIKKRERLVFKSSLSADFEILNLRFWLFWFFLENFRIYRNFDFLKIRF